MALIDLVRELCSLNDDNLAERVIKDSDVQWCLSELLDILEQEEKQNEPLTLEELREMDGKPFWDCASREWYIVAYVAGSRLYTETGTYVDFAEEETEQRFYRRPPEGEEKT